MMKFRKLLWPFSVLYHGVTATRNFLYDTHVLKSKAYSIPVLCVGNLSTGGTGKSPMIELLISLLEENYSIAVLSRGYKRKSKGFKWVQVDQTALEVGDEPLQIKRNFPNVRVAVCADRRTGIDTILKQDVDVILLDDAFQHRKVKPKASIVLTTYSDLYIDDLILPAGNLRESKTGIKRASIVVVTKCPSDISYAACQEIQYRLQLEPHQSLFFSSIDYDKTLYGTTEKQPISYLKNKPFTLVTGIANPAPFVSHLKDLHLEFEHLNYPDHHNFTDAELNELKQKEILVTTQKDFMRLQPKLGKYALYYLPIKTHILHRQASNFKAKVLNLIKED